MNVIFKFILYLHIACLKNWTHLINSQKKSGAQSNIYRTIDLGGRIAQAIEQFRR
jgi:hypothetical protein